MLKCGHTYCQQCLLEIHIQFEKVICPQCDDVTTHSRDISAEDFIKSLTTNFLAYRNDNSTPNAVEEVKTRSLYYRFAQEVTKAKEPYSQPLMSSHIFHNDSGCKFVTLEIIKYLFFAVPFFVALFGFVTFVLIRISTS